MNADGMSKDSIQCIARQPATAGVDMPTVYRRAARDDCLNGIHFFRAATYSAGEDDAMSARVEDDALRARIAPGARANVLPSAAREPPPP